MAPLSVSTQVPAVGLVVGGSTVVVVAVVPAGAAVDGADVAGPEVIGEDGFVVGGSTVVVPAVVPAGAAVDGADVAGPEVIGEDVAGVAVGFAVTTVIVPPPQPQHMSSSVNTAVSNVPSP